MKKAVSSLLSLFILTGLSFIPKNAVAQCKLTLSSAAHDCAPATSTFIRTNTSAKTVSNYSWDFGDGNTSSDTMRIVNHMYKVAGCYTVSFTVTYADASTCKASLPSKICIYDPPTVGIIMPSKAPFGATQCLRHDGGLNKFCLSSSSGNSGAPIVKYFWNFGDGHIDSSNTSTACHSYQAPGTYTISLRVIDTNGCTSVQFKTSALVVLHELFTRFSIYGKAGCNSATYSFTNNTDTPGMNIKSFFWDFGDGSPIDSIHFNISSHTYGPGTYAPVLTIVNRLGCSATDTQHITVTKFKMKLAFKDTACWADAHNNGINFSAQQQPNVVFWQWNFGDPYSGVNNTATYAWTSGHKFAGGPGNYKVHFKMQNSNPKCGINGQLDTCFIVHIKGPMANIQLPDFMGLPANNYVPAYPMSKNYFIAIANNKSSCGPQSVTYSTFTKSVTASRHVVFKYCIADTASKTVDTASDCYGNDKTPYVSSIILKPTDSSISYYYDSTETSYTWTKGSIIPSGNVFFPSKGTLNRNNIHDSNLNTCSLPNLVRFTNNSIKYRLQSQMDDNTYLNVTDPQHSFKDTCRWKNYPMASDSLTYFWKFNDPSGKACTSRLSNKDWECNFSTLAAPYHYYRGTKGLPAGGLQPVDLTATDPKTGCSDSTRLILHQGSARAYWDRSAYCKMNWDLQAGLLPKGYPGSSGPPLRGFQLTGQPASCSGADHKFHIDFTETLPSDNSAHYAIVFDSAAAVTFKKCSGKDSVIDYGFTGSTKKDGYVIGGADAVWKGTPWNGDYWYEAGESGCKTIGIVLQEGLCADTAWYHDYICFSPLSSDFNLFNIIPASGPVRTEYFADYSANSHGHICQRGFDEGINIRLYPSDTTQKQVTRFKYEVTRKPIGDNAWGYYTLPFWPDSATLNPFTTWNDSIKQVDSKVFYIDTPHLYTIVNLPGLPPYRLAADFPLYKNEIDSLNARKHVNIPVTDPRTRRISVTCGQKFITLYTDKVVLKSATQILKLSGFNAVDSVILPYPGFYTITSVANNLQGCSQQTVYHLIYGHFAAFNANNDSVICLGQKVNFSYYVRYWSTQCPPSAGGGPAPEGCLNGADEGMPTVVDFNPWDSANPTAFRDALVPNWSTTQKPANYQPEQLWWNFGDNPFFNKIPNGSKVSHTYTKPGVYTVSMRTIDWRGCAVTTMRRNFIKVIQPICKFELLNLKDTLNYCGPKTIGFVSKSYVLGGTYTDKVVKNGKIVDSTYVVDQILQRIWQPGDGRTFTRFNSDSFIGNYPENGVFSVALTVKTGIGCSDEMVKKNYVTITGPMPKFEIISSTSGCAPFTAYIRNHNTKNVKSNTWHFGDSISKTLFTQPFGDSLVMLSYTAPRGRFRISVSQTDTFRDSKGNPLPPCTSNWPDISDPVQYWVNILPHSAIRLHGNRIIFQNKTGIYTSISGYGEYKNFNWDFGNGNILSNTKDSVSNINYTLAQCTAAPKDAGGRAIFLIKVTALTDSGCLQTDTFHVYVDFTTGINEKEPSLSDLNIYPNPFSSGTTIDFALIFKTNLRIELMDINGRQIGKVSNGVKSPGKYSIELNSSDYQLSPGVYLLKFITDEGVVSRQLSVVR